MNAKFLAALLTAVALPVAAQTGATASSQAPAPVSVQKADDAKPVKKATKKTAQKKQPAKKVAKKQPVKQKKAPAA